MSVVRFERGVEVVLFTLSLSLFLSFFLSLSVYLSAKDGVPLVKSDTINVWQPIAFLMLS